MKNYLLAIAKNETKVAGIIYLTINDQFTQKKVNKVDASHIASLKKLKFENIKFTSKGLIGTNGKIDRYPTIICKNGKKEIKNENSIIILCRTEFNEEKGFCISDKLGNISFLSETNALKVARKTGIANGKVVGNFISSIEGEYITISDVNFIKKTDSNVTKEPEIKVWDLSNNSKSIQEHINAIRNELELKNKISMDLGKKLFKSLKPVNTSKLFMAGNYNQLIAEYVHSINSYKDIFENCEFTYTDAINTIKNMQQEMLLPDYKAQVLSKMPNKIQHKKYMTEALIKDNHNNSIFRKGNK